MTNHGETPVGRTEENRKEVSGGQFKVGNVIFSLVTLGNDKPVHQLALIVDSKPCTADYSEDYEGWYIVSAIFLSGYFSELDNPIIQEGVDMHVDDWSRF